MTFGGVISGSGLLEHRGTGTLTLTGENSYTGGTAIHSGTLVVSRDTNLGDVAGGIELNGGALRATASFATQRAVALAGSGTIITDENTTLTLRGALSGNGSLIKNGGGSLTLNDENSYTGPTTVHGGVLRIDGDQSAATGVVTVANGAALGGRGIIGGDALTLTGPQSIVRVGDGSTADYSATIDAVLGGTTRLIKEDAGSLILTGENTYTGGTTIHGGTLVVSRDTNLGDVAGGIEFDGGALRTTDSFTSQRAVALAGHGTIITDENATLTLSGALSGNGSLIKNGAGSLILTGDNSTYVAHTQVMLGTLTVNGTLGGQVDVAASARLEGTGRVGGISNTGAVAPAGDGFGTLTVAGNYVGNGGTLEIETVLGDDASATDRLVIEGDTFGTTKIKVVNRGGLGAQTIEGIKIVDVAGASNGTFTLDSDYLFEGDPAVIGGAYAYRLYKNGITDPTDGDWYLRSSLIEPDDPSPTPPAPPPPLYQPGVPVYEGYAQTLLRLNDLPTLEERVGNRFWTGGSTEGAGGMWGRIEGMRYRPDAAFSTTGADKDIDSWQMQIGLEGTLAQRGANTTLIGALTAHYGKASSQITSSFGNGSIDAKGYGVGATLSWYGPQGVYVDGQVQFGWFASDLTSDILGTLASNNDGTGEAFSIELGKRVPVGVNLNLTPQMQMIYEHVDFDSFTDTSGAVVSAGEARSVRTRWGLAIDHQVTTAQNRSSHLYGIVNLSYEWQPNTSVRVSATQIVNRERNLWGELGLGGTYNWNDRITLYAQGSAETALGNFGRGYAMKGTMGFRVRF